MKRSRSVLIVTMVFLTLHLTVTWGHSGRTDSKGGHQNKKTSKYHFHGFHKGKHEKFNGTVTEVISGDTIVVTDKRKAMHTVRLLEIDAPELKQKFGKASKALLSKKALGKVVLVTWEKTDGRKKLLGHVYFGDHWLNLDLVREGAAWHFTRVSKDGRIADAEASARKALKGLWSSGQPTPPWEFR